MRAIVATLFALALTSCDRSATPRPSTPIVERRAITSPPRAATNRVASDLDGDGVSDALVASGALGVQVFRGSLGGMAPSTILGNVVDDPSRISATSLAVARHGASSVAYIGERTANQPSDAWRCTRGRIRVFIFESGRQRELASLEPPAGFAQLGKALQPVGDLDGDGFEEVLAFGASAREAVGRLVSRPGLPNYRMMELCSDPALFLIRGGAAPTLTRLDLARPSEHAVIARFDGGRDPFADLILFHQQLLLYPGVAGGGFAREPVLLEPERSDNVVALALGDLDRDGNTDVVAALAGGSSEVARVYFGPFSTAGDGGASLRTVTLSAPAQDGASSAAPSRGLAVADFDGDRVDDVLIGDPVADRFLLFRGGPSLASSSVASMIRGPEASGTQFGAHVAVVGDLDRDGSPEILAPVSIRTAEGVASNGWLLSPRAPAQRGRAIAPPTAGAHFAHAVASVSSATRGETLEVPPIPRRCTVSDPASLVTISVEANTVESGIVARPARVLVAPPPAAIAAITERVTGARAAIAQCHARWLASDCNNTMVASLPFATLAGGELSSEGVTAARGREAEAVLDCVRDAVVPGRIAAPPRRWTYGVVVTVSLAPAP
jgi:hypothetical protein